MIPPPDDTIETQWLLRPCVYAWKRGEKYLYVGMSSKGIRRPFGSHSVIGRVDFIGLEDVIEVWWFEKPAHAAVFENLAIAELRPKYNRAGFMSFSCLICGHAWASKTDRTPLKCANPVCQSIFWNGEERVGYPSKSQQGAQQTQRTEDSQDA